MPETYSPIQWINNTFPAINESNLNRIEQGVEALDDRAASLELGVISPIAVPYATSVTINATQGSLFRCIASGDVTLDNIVGGTDGQTLVLEVQAAGAGRVLHFTGSTSSIPITIGQWWVGTFRYVAAPYDAWLLTDGSSGGGSGGDSGADLNVLAPQNVPYSGTVTLNAATGALFRITAPGDLTLASPINGTDGQAVIVEILASGGQRTVSLDGGSALVTIPSGGRWAATLRYNGDDDIWLLVEGGSGSADSAGVSSVNNMAGAVLLDADDLADGSAKVMMTTTERAKLTGVAAAATANATDAQLRNRATHTGTQPVSSLSVTGTASSTTYLRGDGAWATPAGGGSGPVTALTETTGAEVAGRVFRLGAADFSATIPTGGPDSAFVVVDKLNDVNDASLLLRSAGVQKAEIGLPGDNDLHLKTVTGSEGSPVYTDAIICKNDTGLVFVPQGLGIGAVPQEKLHVVAAQPTTRLLVKVENTATAGGDGRSTGAVLTSGGGAWYLVTDVGLNGGDNLGIMSDTAGYPPVMMLTPTAMGVGTDAPTARLDVNGALNIAGDNGMAPLRIRGRKTTTGAPTTGTWDAGDAVIDSAGAWHLCQTAGTPGTWT